MHTLNFLETGHATSFWKSRAKGKFLFKRIRTHSYSKIITNFMTGTNRVWKQGVGPSKSRPGVTAQVACPGSWHQLRIQRSPQQVHTPQAATRKSQGVAAPLKWSLPSPSHHSLLQPLHLLHWGHVLVNVCHCPCPIEFLTMTSLSSFVQPA